MSELPDGIRPGLPVIATRSDGTVLGIDADDVLYVGTPKGVPCDAIEAVYVDNGDGTWSVFHHYGGWLQGHGTFDHDPREGASGTVDSSRAVSRSVVQPDGSTVSTPVLKQVIDWEVL